MSEPCVYVFNTQDGKVTSVYTGHREEISKRELSSLLVTSYNKDKTGVCKVAFSPNNTRILSIAAPPGGYYGAASRLHIYDATTMAQYYVMVSGSYCDFYNNVCLVFYETEPYSERFCFVEYMTGRKMASSFQSSPFGGVKSARDYIFSSSDKIIIFSVSHESFFYIKGIDPLTGRILVTSPEYDSEYVPNSEKGKIEAIAVSHNGRYVACYGEGKVTVWRIPEL